MQNHISVNLTSVTDKAPISRDLEKIIVKCLEKVPDKRFQNAEELAKALSKAKTKPERDTATFSSSWKAILVAVIAIGLATLYFHREKTSEPAFKRITELRRANVPHLDASNIYPIKLSQLEEWLEANLDNPLRSPETLAASWCEAQIQHYRNSLPGSTPHTTALYFEFPYLADTLANFYESEKRTDKAIEILKNTISSMRKYTDAMPPQFDRTGIILLSKHLLSLSQKSGNVDLLRWCIQVINEEKILLRMLNN